MFKPTKKQHLVNKAYADKLIVKLNGRNQLDHTWQEIVDAPMAWLEKTSGTRITRDPLSGIIADEGINKYTVVFDGTSYVAFMPDEHPQEDVS